MAKRRHLPIPRSFPVRPLAASQNPPGRTTCFDCGLSWDNDQPTRLTPAPSSRCPFEAFHISQEQPQPARAVAVEPARINELIQSIDNLAEEVRRSADTIAEAIRNSGK